MGFARHHKMLCARLNPAALDQRLMLRHRPEPLAAAAAEASEHAAPPAKPPARNVASSSGCDLGDVGKAMDQAQARQRRDGEA
jgi:hypothetical protein